MRTFWSAAARGLGIAIVVAATLLPARASAAQSPQTTVALPRLSLTSDAPVIAAGPATLRFRLEDPERALAAGDTVEIRFPSCAPWAHTRWVTPQVEDPTASGFVAVAGSARGRVEDFPAIPLCRGNPLPAESKSQPKVLRVVIDAPPAPGEAIEITYGAPGPKGAGRARAQRFPELTAEWKPFVHWNASRTVAREGIAALPSMALEVGRAAASRLHLSGPADARAGEPFDVNVDSLDSLGFPAVPFDEIELRAVHESGKAFGPWHADVLGRDASVHIARVRLDEPGIHWIEASSRRGERPWSVAWALPIRIETSTTTGSGAGAASVPGPAKPRLVFGDLHWHTNHSDGSRSPREGYAYARDVVGLDFTALTDHDAHVGFPCIEDDAWSGVEALAREMQDPGRFAALIGWEYTAGTGHWIVVHRGASGPYRPVSSFSTPEQLWDALVPGESITIAAHPAGGGVVPFMTSTKFDPRFVRAAEIYSLHGSAESPDDSEALARRRAKAEGARVRGTVHELLSRGNRFALLGATDNHTATPGNPVRHTRRDIASGAGLCAAWVDSLTHEGVFDAVHRGSIYATSGPRIRIEVAREGDDVVGVVAGSSKLTAVDLVGIQSGGEIPFPSVHSVPSKGRLARFRWSPDSSLSGTLDGVYLRVVQDDGEMAWSSPLWFSEPGKESGS